MAHDVKFSIPERDLGRADVEFKISHGGSKVGTLKISKGALVWVPKDHTYGFKIGWKDFDALMIEKGVKRINMDSISCRIIVNGLQQTHNIGLIENDGRYYVENPMDKKHALILLDQTRLEKPSETNPTWKYAGILLVHNSIPMD